MTILIDEKYINYFKRNLKRYQKLLEAMKKAGEDTQELERLINKAMRIMENPKDEDN